MSKKYVHLVIAIDPDSGDVVFDGDGTREWVRRLHTPETTTFDFESGEWVSVSPDFERAALDRLIDLGVSVDGIDYDNWQER